MRILRDPFTFGLGPCQMAPFGLAPDRDHFGLDPEHFWSHFDTCQQARVAQTGTQTQKEKVLLLLLLGCCLSVSSVGLFS